MIFFRRTPPPLSAHEVALLKVRAQLTENLKLVGERIDQIRERFEQLEKQFRQVQSREPTK